MEFKIIIESLLTASQFEVTVSASDRILVLKKSIEKILGKALNKRAGVFTRSFSLSFSGQNVVKLMGNLISFHEAQWILKIKQCRVICFAWRFFLNFFQNLI